LEIRADSELARHALEGRAHTLASSIALNCPKEASEAEIQQTIQQAVSREPTLVSIAVSDALGHPKVHWKREDSLPQGASVVHGQLSAPNHRTVSVALDRARLEQQIGFEQHEILVHLVRVLGFAVLLVGAAAVWTPRRRLHAADREVHRLMRRARQVVESLGAALVTVDAHGHLDPMNEAAKRLLALHSQTGFPDVRDRRQP
jgi:PAS domain-containing protein